MSEFFTSRFYAAPAAASSTGWSRWLSAADLTLADANSVTIVSSPADVGDEITVTTRNLSGARVERASACAIYTFDMAQLDPLFDPAKDQLVDMQLEFSAFNDALLAIGPTNTAGTETTMAVGQYYRPFRWHAIQMTLNSVAVRGADASSFLPLMWGSYISNPDWAEGVTAQIIAERTIGSGTTGAGNVADFGGNSTSFAVLLGFYTTADNGDQVSTFKARFAVRDLTP